MALKYLKNEVECGKGYGDRSQTLHYTFKLDHKVSNNGKHLNHLRWIIRNKSKYMSPQGQEP